MICWMMFWRNKLKNFVAPVLASIITAGQAGVGLAGPDDMRVSAPSFQCEDAATEAELIICYDDSQFLRALDLMLAVIYSDLLSKVERELPVLSDEARLDFNYRSAEALRADQQAWLVERNNLQDFHEIEAAYKRRIKDLSWSYSELSGANGSVLTTHYTRQEVDGPEECQADFMTGWYDEGSGHCVEEVPNYRTFSVVIANGHFVADFGTLGPRYVGCWSGSYFGPVNRMAEVISIDVTSEGLLLDAANSGYDPCGGWNGPEVFGLYGHPYPAP